MVRVAFLHRGDLSTFVARDLSALRAAGHEVEVVTYRSAVHGPAVVRAVRRADAALAWFADAHAAFAVAAAPRQVPVLVVLGGYEVEGIPELHYGTFAAGHTLARATVRYVLRRADTLLPVSERTRGEMARRALPRGHVRVLPNAVDPTFFRPGVKVPRVLTVGRFPDMATAWVKGLQTFLGAARICPDIRFLVVGPVAEEVLRLLAPPENVEIRQEVSAEELRDLYATSAVYAQLSAHESFGVALAEAMSAGCVPVVTEAGALPEVVGEVGERVPRSAPEAAAAAIRRALAAGPEAGAAARARIERRFAAADRARALNQEIAQAIGRKVR